MEGNLRTEGANREERMLNRELDLRPGPGPRPGAQTIALVYNKRVMRRTI